MRIRRTPQTGTLTVMGLLVGALAAGCETGAVSPTADATVTLASASSRATDAGGGPEATVAQRPPARLVRTVTPGGFLDGLTLVGGTLWASDVTGDRLVRVDAASGTILAPVPSLGGPLTLVADGSSVWVAHYNGRDVTRYDGRTAAVTATVATPSDKPCGLALLGGQLWVIDQSDGAGVVIDTATARVVQTVHTGVRAGWAGAGLGAVWVPDFQGDTRTISRVDPATGTATARYAVGGAPLMAVPADGSVWVTNNSDNTITRLDPLSGQVLATIPVPAGPAAILAQAHRVWVTSYQGDALTLLDPATNAVAGTVPLPGPAQNMVQVGDHLWVALSNGSLVEMAPS